MTRHHLPHAVLAVALAAAVLVQPTTWARTGTLQEPWAVPDLAFMLPLEVYAVDDLALDRHGNLVVAGITGAPDFPTTADAADRTCGTEGDVFVMVFSARGALRYSTCLGGPKTEASAHVAPAGDGAIWVAASVNRMSWQPGMGSSGTSAALWRVQPGVAGVAGGAEPIWIGGPGTEADVKDLAAAEDSSVWVLATVETAGAPVVNAWQPVSGGAWDILLGHYAPGRSEPLMLTYLGGSDFEWACALAVAPDGDVVLTGQSPSDDFPLVRPEQGQRGGRSDTVVVRVHGSGKWLDYSTFLGGARDEIESDVAVGPEGQTFVVGRAPSHDFPRTTAQLVRWPNSDLFFAALDGSGHLGSLNLLETGLEGVYDMSARIFDVAARPDGLVVHAGAYWAGDLRSAGWFLCLTDEFGAHAREPMLSRHPPGEPAYVKAIVSGRSHVYVATEDRRWPNNRFTVHRLLLRLPSLDAKRPASGHDRR
jgi:hypothetical protein